MALFPDSWLAELLSKSDIVAIASEYTQLKPKGRRLWGCCPFHSEKTPSFSVTPDNQLYYCFGCHAGGSVIQFIMETEKLTYTEAVKSLAQRAGMELPENMDDQKLRNERALKERMYAACKEAALFYHGLLLSEEGKAAQQYLIRRGVDAHTVKSFGLGFAPEGWDRLLKHMLFKDFTKEELIAAGLAVAGKSKDGCYDAYRNRVVFPIVAQNRRVIGFGARTMGKDIPKYLNTGDTPIFNKRSHLYALNMQKGKQLSDLIMVEGYMDVISLCQNGVDNAVASLGTALTQQQARLIKRYVPKVYISYDGDAAGQNATLRGLDILAKEGLDVRVIRIPDGKDPDDYVRQNGKEAYLSLKDQALTLNGFKLDYFMWDLDMHSPDDRETYAKKACTFLGTLQPVEQERYVPLVARRTGLSQAVIVKQCGLVKAPEENRTAPNRNIKENGRLPRAEASKAEKELLACMLKSGDALVLAMEEMTERNVHFCHDELMEVAEKLLVGSTNGEQTDIRLLMCGFTPQTAEIISAAAGLCDSIEDPEAAAAQCINAMAKAALDTQIKELAGRLAGGEDVRSKYMELVTKRASL